MKYFRVVCLLSLLGGCGTAPQDGIELGQVWGALREGRSEPTPPVDILAIRAALTPAVLAQITEPVIILQVPRRDSVVAIARVARNAGVDTFLTTDGLSLSTKDGIVVATRGFGFDLMTADIGGPLAAVKGDASMGVRLHTYLDGENHTVHAEFACRYRRSGPVHLSETCQSAHHSFENSYDLDLDGRIVASRQWISPQVGSVLIDRLN